MFSNKYQFESRDMCVTFKSNYFEKEEERK